MRWILIYIDIAKVRRKWGDRATIGRVDQSPLHIRQAGGIQIIYLQPGHTLTPVSALYHCRVGRPES
jgi:hypothetical protein